MDKIYKLRETDIDDNSEAKHLLEIVWSYFERTKQEESKDKVRNIITEL